ncbi:hypothetical protein BDV37DRAFT_241663 [Aspergillus pseudonomiae]|uniref:Uncharacterized protein n=1 Tax=Aspergillus pseudonomiae TaxID=1506151 RepID=A0A5N7DKL5_9EURO|nr:uncharacterized protein BDV37DRAFT_241663 [Aspergillus pseudonomiae]KAE8406991.1 hypothetical protein BDV37DRAFT_241663 [Aspergillus pseudonomiae]
MASSRCMMAARLCLLAYSNSLDYEKVYFCPRMGENAALTTPACERATIRVLHPPSSSSFSNWVGFYINLKQPHCAY